MSAEKRNKSIKIRVTEDEFLKLNEKKVKAGFSMLAEYMRSVSLELKTQTKNEYPKIDPALQRQISGVGNNLNQIARQVNSSELKPSDSMQIISYLSSIDRTLEKIRGDWRLEK